LVLVGVDADAQPPAVGQLDLQRAAGLELEVLVGIAVVAVIHGCCPFESLVGQSKTSNHPHRDRAAGHSGGSWPTGSLWTPDPARHGVDRLRQGQLRGASLGVCGVHAPYSIELSIKTQTQ